jgi:putative tryptophan/tyrosine transport system substrate-binding protein
MRRLDFPTLLGGATAAWLVAARAQLGPYAERLAAFHRGLKQGGFVEGANLAVEYRWGEDHVDRLPALAADFSR